MYFCLQLINPVFVDFFFLNEIFYYNSKKITQITDMDFLEFFSRFFFLRIKDKGNYF